MLYSFEVSGLNLTIAVVDEVLHDTRPTLMDIIKSNPRLSIIHKLIAKSSLQDLLDKEHSVKEVCFDLGQCLTITGALKEHFNNLKLFKQFTFQLPDNSVFEAMSSVVFKRLQRSPHRLQAFLKKHIFLGILKHSENKKILATSLKKKEPVTMIIPPENKKSKPITHDSHQVFSIDESVRVKEGLVQILMPYRKQ